MATLRRLLKALQTKLPSLPFANSLPLGGLRRIEFPEPPEPPELPPECYKPAPVAEGVKSTRDKIADVLDAEVARAGRLFPSVNSAALTLGSVGGRLKAHNLPVPHDQTLRNWISAHPRRNKWVKD